MNILRFFTLIVLSTVLTACSDPIVYQEADDNNNNSENTRIIKIEIVRKTCNKLTLNVTYFNDGKLPGYLRLSPNAGIPNQLWPFLPKMAVGTHTMEIQNGLQDTEEVVHSQEVSVAIEHIKDNTWKGYIDRKTFAYEAEWSNKCFK